MLTKGDTHIFIELINILKKKAFDISVKHGFSNNHLPTAIALMHSELSEALEWCRKDINAPSDHIEEFSGVEEELADVIICILDTAERNNLALGAAILRKMKFNKDRPVKHGGKQF